MSSGVSFIAAGPGRRCAAERERSGAERGRASGCAVETVERGEVEQVDKGASMLLVIMDEAGRLHAIACTHAPKDARTE